jgi:asparagine synthase (glutamine-hydrolysing)
VALNLPTVLGITDRNSMAHSLEARVPFLDHRMIEFAFRLPASFKVGEGRRKRILREVAKPYVSSDVISRTDSLGFGTPQKRWMAADLWRDVQAAAHHSIFAQNALIDSKVLTRDVDQFVHGNGTGDATRMWMVWALQAWYQTFDVLPE